MMEPDGGTRLAYIPYLPSLRYALQAAVQQEEAAARKALIAKVEELGEAPTFEIPLPEAKPKNWRPWHEHTLPNRKRRK